MRLAPTSLARASHGTSMEGSIPWSANAVVKSCESCASPWSGDELRLRSPSRPFIVQPPGRPKAARPPRGAAQYTK
jgi:hypothetical protein